ncbi:MAG: hypothetical protein JXR91_15735 [Deltaproteobacteria bacterium]|nr:hypothetical protein [Deltaproteobacteria bacterium]
METRKVKNYSLGNINIYICPACGVVNPAGPSNGCPHLQLVQFNGASEPLEDLIMDVAHARRLYAELTGTLKRVIMSHVQDGTAHVMTPHQVSESEVNKLYASAGQTSFSLTSPGTEQSPKGKTKRNKKAAGKKVKDDLNETQLDLLAYSSPKGNA